MPNTMAALMQTIIAITMTALPPQLGVGALSIEGGVLGNLSSSNGDLVRGGEVRGG